MAWFNWRRWLRSRLRPRRGAPATRHRRMEVELLESRLAPARGRVVLTIGKRSNGWPFFSVSDNGPGVSEDNRRHLFEPHFTTKETGTGLGLFVSYGIIREHQGRLLFEAANPGAVFTIILPIASAEQLLNVNDPYG